MCTSLVNVAAIGSNALFCTLKVSLLKVQLQISGTQSQFI